MTALTNTFESTSNFSYSTGRKTGVAIKSKLKEGKADWTNSKDTI